MIVSALHQAYFDLVQWETIGFENRKGKLMNSLNKAELLITRSLVITHTKELSEEAEQLFTMNQDQKELNDYKALIAVNAAIVLKLSRQIRGLKS